MTPRETWNACKGYNDKVQRSWEQARWIGTMAFNSMRKPKRPDELLEFPWDQENKEEQIDEGLRKLKEYKEKWQRQ